MPFQKVIISTLSWGMPSHITRHSTCPGYSFVFHTFLFNLCEASVRVNRHACFLHAKSTSMQLCREDEIPDDKFVWMYRSQSVKGLLVPVKVP